LDTVATGCRDVLWPMMTGLQTERMGLRRPQRRITIWLLMILLIAWLMMC
tara:strand:+ start:902 stop:1051 length:150 start_codon:yes stop_codon:yes gene_type:complete